MAIAAADSTSAGAINSIASSSGGAGLEPANATNRFHCAVSTNSIATQIATLAANGTKRNRRINRMTIMDASPVGSIRHRHGAQRQALAGGELLRRALELAAGRENVAAARRAHRRGITGVEHHLGELLDLVPVGALV